MRIVVFNCGSSSVKFSFADVYPSQSSSIKDAFDVEERLSGSVTGIGGLGRLEYRLGGASAQRLERPLATAEDAVAWVCDFLVQTIRREDVGLQIDAVGHRVVHGGTHYSQSALVTDRVIHDIAELGTIAPLHNPLALQGIQAARDRLGPDVPMVAVFDTSFHRTLPLHAQTYALPEDLVQKYRIVRYGFHGIAHAALADGYARLTGRSLAQQRLITLQLGNGCSITAQRNGQSVDTSMGFTPLEGLVMGTRAGDLDASIVSFLIEREGVRASEVERWLNERSGLLGISGRSADMRELLAAAEACDTKAALAIEVFCYRIQKYIGAYLAVLGGADAVIFGGGIGEHAPAIRQRVCRDLRWCGIELDRHINDAVTSVSPGHGVCISRPHSGVPVYVIGTNEQAWIAKETASRLLAE